MNILTFGYKVTSGGYLETLEDEWRKLGHKIASHFENCDFIFNLDRSQIDKAYYAHMISKKPLYCCVLDVPVMEGTNLAWKHYNKQMMEFETKVYSECEKVFAISKETGRCLKKYNKAESTVTGIPALSHSQFYEERDRGNYVYYFGRATDPIKRMNVLYEALKGTGIDLYISGRFTETFPKYSGVKCFGRLERDKVDELLKRAYIVVDPAIWHGLGMQPIESALTGTACISADIQVKRDVWGDLLPLFQPDNIKDLREKILDFRYLDLEWEKIQKIAEWYLPERVAKRILEEIGCD